MFVSKGQDLNLYSDLLDFFLICFSVFSLQNDLEAKLAEIEKRRLVSF